MHPRNPYRNPPDFKELANAYEPLRRHLIQTAAGTATVNFKDELAQRTLTKALLHRDFNLSLSIPSDRLCPPARRLNYVLWIQDIIHATRCCYPRDTRIRGIDIGTGASAIYPLLLCRLSPEWRMVGTELDERSLRCGQENIARNNLSNQIHIVPAMRDGPILPASVVTSTSSFDFTMCNPPFYSSAEDIVRSAECKEFEPSAVCTGAEVEMITEGGECLFVRRMVEESLHFRERCSWYTSMLGKLSSVSEVVALLHSNSIDNYGITEFTQGQTRRWAIAWSFGDVHLPDTLARISNPTLRSDMPAHTILQEPIPTRLSLSSVRSLLESIPGVVVASDPVSQGSGLVCTAAANTWSRAARRKFASSSMVVAPSDYPILVTRLAVCPAESSCLLEFAWVRGRDRGAFESFCSHVARKLRDAV
ncbi:hypothetical protein K488DRAFT_47114 [Vararia minispora EC-137]|uniref:Uncharacterized protein n=1 Tax=Vararia minispora EC-137 TaxID=1314806 RepID=A0ACB8QQN6_9AGAM|nr:hypothetical protein K488DRAFT_47114 [Vararia minispora EC-137]